MGIWVKHTILGHHSALRKNDGVSSFSAAMRLLRPKHTAWPLQERYGHGAGMSCDVCDLSSAAC